MSSGNSELFRVREDNDRSRCAVQPLIGHLLLAGGVPKSKAASLEGDNCSKVTANFLLDTAESGER